MADENVIWRDVAGFEDYYRISNMGDLFSKRSGRVLAKALNTGGYVDARLFSPDKVRRVRLHRLVAETFIGPGEGLEVNHKNGIKTDNRAENLEWVTHSENTRHGHYVTGKQIKGVIGTAADGTEISFRSIHEAGRSGFSTELIHDCLAGRQKTSGGYTWRRAPGVQERQQPAIKLTAEKVVEIRRRASAGEATVSIADAFGITETHARNVISRKVWPDAQPAQQGEREWLEIPAFLRRDQT